jgi:hypothetical protein
MNIEWLLDCKPRPVQEEAILRSYYGYMSRNHRDETPTFEKIRSGVAHGWGHFLEMRLGKSPTLLNEFLLLQKYHDVDRMVILSPNTYKKTWAMEVPAFGVLTPVHAFETSQIDEAYEFLEEHPKEHILVINYEALIHEGPRKLLTKVVDAGVLLAADESIKIKNHASQTTRAALDFAPDAGYRRVLSGRPMTQGPQDIYPQLRFIGGLQGQNFFAFRNKFCTMGGFKGKKITGVKNEHILTEVINSRAFVAKRIDWGRITEPEHYLMQLEMTPKQAKHYREMDEELVTMLDSGEEISVSQVVSKLLKLQQISSGFLYQPDGRIVFLDDPAKTPKMKAITELLEDEISNKVIIPYHYSASGDLLLEVLKQYNPAVIRSAGWMKKNERNADDEKKRFNTDPACRVILLQIQAGKYGHTLTGVEGDRCTHMLFFENTYSYDDRSQIEMRNTAETQDWTNVYIDFVSSPVERNATDALQRKEDIVTAVFGTYNPNKEVKER